jgi:hypothetical protein
MEPSPAVQDEEAGEPEAPRRTRLRRRCADDKVYRQLKLPCPHRAEPPRRHGVRKPMVSPQPYISLTL